MPVSFTVTLGQLPGPAHNWWDVFSGCSKMYCPRWGDGFNEHLPDCRKLILNIFNMATYFLLTMCSHKAFHLSHKVTCPSCRLWEVKQLWPEVCVRPPSAPAAVTVGHHDVYVETELFLLPWLTVYFCTGSMRRPEPGSEFKRCWDPELRHNNVCPQ